MACVTTLECLCFARSRGVSLFCERSQWRRRVCAQKTFTLTVSHSLWRRRVCAQKKFTLTVRRNAFQGLHLFAARRCDSGMVGMHTRKCAGLLTSACCTGGHFILEDLGTVHNIHSIFGLISVRIIACFDTREPLTSNLSFLDRICADDRVLRHKKTTNKRSILSR